MVSIAIAGASGRMGRSLLQAALAHPDLQLAALLDRADSPLQGVDAGLLLSQVAMGIRVGADVDQALQKADVLIDFTRPDVSLIHAAHCARLGKSLVIGTTGFTGEQQQQLELYAEKIAIVHAPNMSPGVNLAFKLVELAARALQGQVDVEIIEAHHHHKLDSPSGTALRFGEVVAKQLNLNLRDHAVYGREGQVGARPKQQIGFSTVRGGDIVGEHSVWFIGDGERLEITHRASSRENFAAGALRAAVWSVQQLPGLYDMPDVLGLNELA